MATFLSRRQKCSYVLFCSFVSFCAACSPALDVQSAINDCNIVNPYYDAQGRCNVDLTSCPDEGGIFMICSDSTPGLLDCVCTSTYDDDASIGPLTTDPCTVGESEVKDLVVELCG